MKLQPSSLLSETHARKSIHISRKYAKENKMISVDSFAMDNPEERLDELIRTENKNLAKERRERSLQQSDRTVCTSTTKKTRKTAMNKSYKENNNDELTDDD